MLSIWHDMISPEIITKAETWLSWADGGLEDLYGGVPIDRDTGKIYVSPDILIDKDVRVDVGYDYVGSLYLKMDGPREVEGISLVFDKDYNKKIQLILKDSTNTEYLFEVEQFVRSMYFLTKMEYIIEIEVRFFIFDKFINEIKLESMVGGWFMTYKLSDMLDTPRLTQNISSYVNGVEYDELYFYLNNASIPIDTNQRLELSYYGVLEGVFWVSDFEYTKMGIKITARNTLSLLDEKVYRGRYYKDFLPIETAITNLLGGRYDFNLQDTGSLISTRIKGVLHNETYIQALFDLISASGYYIHTTRTKNVEFIVPNPESVIYTIEYKHVFENYKYTKSKDGYTGIEMSSYAFTPNDSPEEILIVENADINIYYLDSVYVDLRKNGVPLAISEGYEVVGEFSIGDVITGKKLNSNINEITKERQLHINESSNLVESNHNMLINNNNVNDLLNYYLNDMIYNDTLVIKADIPKNITVGDFISVDLKTVGYKGMITQVQRLLTNRRNIATLTLSRLSVYSIYLRFMRIVTTRDDKKIKPMAYVDDFEVLDAKYTYTITKPNTPPPNEYNAAWWELMGDSVDLDKAVGLGMGNILYIKAQAGGYATTISDPIVIMMDWFDELLTLDTELDRNILTMIDDVDYVVVSVDGGETWEYKIPIDSNKFNLDYNILTIIDDVDYVIIPEGEK